MDTTDQTTRADFSAVAEADNSRMKIRGQLARIDNLLACPCGEEANEAADSALLVTVSSGKGESIRGQRI